MTRTGPFADRRDAGLALAEQLTEHAGREDVVVVALPRGGVPVAAPVAEGIDAPLDVTVVRKLGVPGQPELAMGAIAGTGDRVETVYDQRVLDAVAVPAHALDDVRRRELRELHRREQAYRGQRPGIPLSGRRVVLVDDGLATGSTMRAAAAAVRRQAPDRLVVAVPVGSADTCEALRQLADEVVCAWSPEPFFAVGQGYHDFRQTEDDEVRSLLAEADARWARRRSR